MAQVYRDVLRFDVGRLQVQHVEVFAQLDDVARVFQRARALAVVEVGNMRRAADAGKGDIIAAEGDIGRRFRTVEDEFRGCRFER